MLSRRVFGILTVAAFAGGAASSRRSGAAETKALSTLSDGFMELRYASLVSESASLELGVEPGGTLTPACNVTVLRWEDRLVLFDAGSGPNFMPSAGRLPDSLDAAGIDPAGITHVVITHAHPDHIWGIRDDFDEAILPDAQKFIGGAERDFWMQDGLATSVPAEMQQFVVGAVNSIEVDGAEWTTVADGDEIAPGIRVIDSPGHTPGHMSVVVESDGQQIVALGDALSHAYISFAKPGWYNEFDMDGEQTVATRQQLLDMAAADRMAVIGYHFPFPGVGHVMREGEAYRFIPALWRFDD